MTDSHGGGQGRDSASALETRILVLEAQAGAHQSRLRDAERSLVDRIADVDDDRRRSLAQLQRAIEGRSEEHERVLRRRLGLLWLALVLVLAAAVAAPLWLLRQGSAELAALRQELARVSSAQRGDAALEERLTEVATAVARLSAALGELVRDQARAAAAPRPPAEAPASDQAARLAGEIERLEDSQRELAARLEAAHADLAGRLTAAEQGANGAPEQVGEAPEPGTGPEAPPAPAPPAAGEGVVLEPAGTDAPAPPGAEARPTPSAPPSADGAPDLVTERPLFALQLIGLRSIERFRDFATGGGLEPPLWYLREIRGGRPWYSLIAGLYPQADTARTVLEGMPAEIRALDPWIRPLPAGTRLWRLEQPSPEE